MMDEEVCRNVLEVLQRELGADGLAPFLRLHRSRGGDKWRNHPSLGAVLQSISTNRNRES